MSRYVVTAKQVFVLLPSGLMIGRKQVSENTMLPQGATLPDTVNPEAIAHLLANGMIEEVAD